MPPRFTAMPLAAPRRADAAPRFSIIDECRQEEGRRRWPLFTARRRLPPLLPLSRRWPTFRLPLTASHAADTAAADYATRRR
jgi:hypothetical protein